MHKNRSLIMVFNAGSSSLKFAVFQMSAGEKYFALVNGAVNHIGNKAEFFWRHMDQISRKSIDIHDHEYAAEWIIDWLSSLWPCGVLIEDIAVVAHRFVHGGVFFRKPIIIDAFVSEKLESLTPLSPRQMSYAFSVLKKSQNYLNKNIPAIATFDTTFFKKLSPFTNFTLSKELTEKHGIAHYGCHGFAHRSMYRQLVALQGLPKPDSKVITFQLGHTCSITAIKNGIPIDTTAEFSLLEGQLSGNRWNIDPVARPYLLNHGHEVLALTDVLYQESRLQGISSYTTDMRELFNAHTSDEAALVINMFSYLVQKELGAYIAILQGVDIIVFSGGIGENAPEIRKRICADMAWYGIQLDEKRNQRYEGKAMIVSSDASRVSVYVIPSNEEILIAEDAKSVLPAPSQNPTF